MRNVLILGVALLVLAGCGGLSGYANAPEGASDRGYTYERFNHDAGIFFEDAGL